MAIGAGAASAWEVGTAIGNSLTMPAHSAGNLLLIVAACKAADIANVDATATEAGWSRLGEFVDGSVNSGSGTGSVYQAVFWKIATSSSEPGGVNFAVATSPNICVVLAFTKGAGEVWKTPVLVQKATNSATSISVTMNSNPGITAGDVGVVVHTTRDDSALTVPSWSATGLTLGSVVEFPATAIATATSNDMAGDVAYRPVTSGTASAAPVVTGTQAAAETGVSAFIRLRVETAAPQTPTPSAFSLAMTTAAPTVAVSDHKVVTPSAFALAMSMAAPTVVASDNKIVIPSAFALALTMAAPTVVAGASQVITPGAFALGLTMAAPTVVASDHKTVTPDAFALALTMAAPTVVASDHKVVTPGAFALVFTGYEPEIVIFDGTALVVPEPFAIVFTGSAPTVVIAEGGNVHDFYEETIGDGYRVVEIHGLRITYIDPTPLV